MVWQINIVKKDILPKQSVDSVCFPPRDRKKIYPKDHMEAQKTK
jgi:hypothetical protein